MERLEQGWGEFRLFAALFENDDKNRCRFESLHLTSLGTWTFDDVVAAIVAVAAVVAVAVVDAAAGVDAAAPVVDVVAVVDAAFVFHF